MLSWRAKRQIIYAIIFAILIGLFLWLIVSWLTPAPTCFDGKQNQKEEAVDCGGPCAKQCTGEVKNFNILWIRAIEAASGSYDAAALVENPNFSVGARKVAYKFKLYDDRNVTIAIREGETFVNPGERFVIFESAIPTGEKNVARAILEWSDLATVDWLKIDKEKPNLLVVRKNFVNEPAPYLEARVRNDAPVDIQNVYMSAVLYDVNGNVMAVSQTLFDFFAALSERSAFFTWSKPFAAPPASIEIFLRANQTE
ncbi:MAG: hypothetical protein HZC14_02905 [Candidatus Niyogibacteria bacterium]|nr:hypothetical protein [Candidatus Niyogibacteria bacterium]